jgi:hypothetical protein
VVNVCANGKRYCFSCSLDVTENDAPTYTFTYCYRGCHIQVTCT